MLDSSLHWSAAIGATTRTRTKGETPGLTRTEQKRIQQNLPCDGQHTLRVVTTDSNSKTGATINTIVSNRGLQTIVNRRLQIGEEKEKGLVFPPGITTLVSLKQASSLAATVLKGTNESTSRG